MKITPKYQTGGSFESFFTTYVPIQWENPTTTGQSSSSSKSDTGELTQKDFFNMIKDIDGLPNDMNEIVSKLTATFQMTKLTGLDTGDLATTYLENLYQIRVANQNYKEYQEAIKRATANGSLAEPAISLDGRLIAQNNKGDLTYVSLDQYYDNPNDYQLLSVSNLANLRKYDPSLSFNQSILDIINNSTGYEEFQNLIEQAKVTLGSTKYSETSVSNKEALEGLQIVEGMTDEQKSEFLESLNNGTYKVSEETNSEQIKSLINYLTTALPDRIKTWASIKLNDPNKEQATTKLVGQYLAGNLKYSKSVQAQIPKSSSSSSGDGSSGVLDSKIYGTPAKFLAGAGVRSNFVINSGTNHAYQVIVNTLPLTDKDDNPLGANSTFQDVTRGTYSSILDLNNVTVGGVGINPAGFNGVILLDGRINSVDYPIDLDAYNRDGSIVPDTSPTKAKAKQDAEKEIRQLGINLNSPEQIKQNYENINKIYQKYNLTAPYNSNGDLTNEWRRFGVVNVAVNNKLLGLGWFNKNPLLKEIKDGTLVDNLRQISEDSKFSNPNEDYYSGTLWVPIQESYVAATSGEKMKGSEIFQLDTQDQILQERSSWKSGRKIQ